MTNKRRTMEEIFKDCAPPEVQQQEWDRTWREVLRGGESVANQKRSEIRHRMCAFAAVFVLGLAIGVLASRMTSSPGTYDHRFPSPGNGAPKSLKEVGGEEEKGSQRLCGLSRIEITALNDENSEEYRKYKLTALTPSGARVVYTYRGLSR